MYLKKVIARIKKMIEQRISMMILDILKNIVNQQNLF